MKIFALLATAVLAQEQVPQVSNQVPVVTNHTDIIDNQAGMAFC